jgi:succinate-semialdehyde dehydrogenase/glutarate-semialdehyde dehydrogenase
MYGKLLINGEWVESKSKKAFAVYNPSDGQEIGKCALASGDDAQLAVASAAQAQKAWGATLGKERGILLRKLYEIVRRDKEEFAGIIVLEQGKSIHEARAEVEYALIFIEWFAEEAKRLYGEVVPNMKPQQRCFNIKQPVGVCAAITPWNFPLAMLARKVAPAMAAGCTMVVKPSEETPLTALLFAQKMLDVGFPKGVMNVICGDAAAIGDVLCQAREVRLLTFTGSTKVGKILMAKCANTVKKVTLELGGNAPFIVFDDADIEQAVRGLLASKIRNGGQSCICANRIYVQKSVISEFAKKLVSYVDKVKIGDGFDEANNLGPMINKAAIKKINMLLDDARLNEANLLYKSDISNLDANGCYSPIIVIENQKENTAIEHSEIFGPVISIFAFETEEEVLERANNTNYGLASYLFTKDKDRAWRMSEALEYGMVAVNDVTLSTELTPFGGIKESGLGREGGRHGILEFLEDKFIAMS